MNCIEKWLLKRIFRKQVIQGYDHDKRIGNLFLLIRQACKDEFTEDNDATITASLTDWFNAAMQEAE